MGFCCHLITARDTQAKVAVIHCSHQTDRKQSQKSSTDEVCFGDQVIKHRVI